MLRKNLKSTPAAPAEGSFAIIASKYNPRYVEGMLQAALAELHRAALEKPLVVRVPGAFEVPVVAAKLLKRKTPLAGIICLGVILRGQTTHAQAIADAVTASLAQLQVEYTVPLIHEVLLLENEAQAVVRCLDKTHNRGTEAAQTALEMARIMRSL
ncbi:MAG TPA: 6,7-dimethyl-8-ribityllumazine synthase [Verrucomicrobiae bacterium]|jgi:6,7-dimethyl-8-ribityllumazine synthase|nr:6,7-dimethyl-8-ribityllumazine synthase [Verrucomicrobiae bacterium]